MVGELWTGKAQSRKAIREYRVGLGDIRRTAAHRISDESTGERHTTAASASESEAAHLALVSCRVNSLTHLFLTYWYS